ncbi:isopropylmalate isomerase [Synechococcus sp. RSCCF101]|uniref:3-isopropylmalate dehydratase small subunit n=1 Tax=Synechococcus sp. RSCCF101 TaxID=2511069 RepID=UPI0012478E9D|nr:isopropylmalate isomerase [Synechococcus sp. RSCCF101]
MVLRGNDIDTDRIIPARFLKCVSFQGLGAQVFADDRQELQGAHPFDRPVNQGASILVVNGNFGCGSSREHAPQALLRWGIRAIVAESFAEIFFGNGLALGIPCLCGTSQRIHALQDAVEAHPDWAWHLSVADETLSAATGELTLSLSLPAGPRQMLLSGRWDGTSQLLANGSSLAATQAALPYLNGFRS